MFVDAFLTPYFPETENQFDGSIVVMIDVLRASSTVCAALNAGAKEVIPSDSLDKAVKIYNSLSKEVRFLGGERNGLKPPGFDAGNSPIEYTKSNVKGKSVILSTTNGTKTFQKAKNAKYKIIATFVNLSTVINYIRTLIINNDASPKLFILCAGTNGRLSYEDVLCAGAIISNICSSFNIDIITDTADVARNLFYLHENDLKSFLYSRDHARNLISLGFESDLEFCFTIDSVNVLPLVTSDTIKAFQNDL